MKTRSMALLVIALSLGGPLKCFAEEPSKEETKDYLKKLIADEGTFSISYMRSKYELETTLKFDEDKLSWTAKQTVDGRLIGFDHNVHVSALNPGRVAVEGTVVGIYQVWVRTPGKVKAINTKLTTSTEWGKSDHEKVACFKDERDAKRFAKALTHLITLCGGKKDAFDD